MKHATHICWPWVVECQVRVYHVKGEAFWIRTLMSAVYSPVGLLESQPLPAWYGTLDKKIKDGLIVIVL